MEPSKNKTSRTYEAGMPVQYARGVGPRIAEKLANIGIRTIEDLLYYFPRDWEDRKHLPTLKEVRPGQETTLKGIIQMPYFQETKGGLVIITALLKDGTGEILCKWMRKRSWHYDVLEPFRKELEPGKTIFVHGKVSADLGGVFISVDEHDVLKGGEDDLIHMDRIVPIYALTEGIRSRFLRTLIYETLQNVSVPDPLPETVRREFKLVPLEQALKGIHFPESFAEKEEARRRLAFQELFMVQTVLAIARKRRKVPRPFQYTIAKNLLSPFKEKCGFDFTRSQKKVINEIFSDLTSPFPMNRLIQGDVGSGKTVVALSAMLLAAENKKQSVLMAPTEILAEQHFITMKHFLESLPVKLGILTGSVTAKEKKQFLKDCAEGNIDIAVGTHALLEDDVKFKDLALAVVDEQHRFGVRHRMDLTRQAGASPDVLVMTATPIPRTLSLSLYGDLDISAIDEMPPGRQAIQTVHKSARDAYGMIKKEVEKGRQAYIVYPLVDESDKIELKSAIAEFERLKNTVFKGTEMGLLHGQMKGKEKEKVMNAFHSGKFPILVATTVIEVGIDVPNATVIAIENAERFGLATLHQLRGRVGRGKDPAWCVLISSARTLDAQQRMAILLSTSNGFELAEKDLEIRGPGEIFGTSQHGIPPLKISNLVRDRSLVEDSRKSARARIESDPDLKHPENASLKKHLHKNFSSKWFWANIA